MSKAGKRLIESAQQALDFARGITDSSHYQVNIPSQIDVRQVRENMKMSQQDFAKSFDFELANLEAWEQGRLIPSGLARNFLILLQADPGYVHETCGKVPL